MNEKLEIPCVHGTLIAHKTKGTENDGIEILLRVPDGSAESIVKVIDKPEGIDVAVKNSLKK